MIASIPWLQSALNVFQNVRVVPKYMNCSPFRRVITYLHVVVLSCMLVSTLKMESARSSATIVSVLQATWRHIVKGVEVRAWSQYVEEYGQRVHFEITMNTK